MAENDNAFYRLVRSILNNANERLIVTLKFKSIKSSQSGTKDSI